MGQAFCWTQAARAFLLLNSPCIPRYDSCLFITNRNVIGTFVVMSESSRGITFLGTLMALDPGRHPVGFPARMLSSFIAIALNKQPPPRTYSLQFTTELEEPMDFQVLFF